MIPKVLTIAGSDPSGGAGIQADLKAFSALGAYGMAALTALTAQNTRGVIAVHSVPPDFIAAQIDAIFDDVAVDAVKIGMVGTAPAAAAVAESLQRNAARTVVLDPVMVAKSGHRLLDDDAVSVLRERLLPLARVVTPNLPEAGVLLGRDAPTDLESMRAAAADLHRQGPHLVLIKGGHLDGVESPDLLYDGERFVELTARRFVTRNTHGTGCTLSAAIAALLPQRATPKEAVAEAKHYLTAAIRASNGLAVGSGHGPVHHFHALWPTSVNAAMAVAR